MKKTLLFLAVAVWWLGWCQLIEAKLLPRFRSSGSGSYTSGVGIVPRLRGDRLALIVYFSNLNKAKNLQYTLIYETNGKQEGVSGTVDGSAGNTASRELTFGTCSAGVCRYHTGLTNMKLEVITTLTNGKRTIRRFRIKV